VAVINAGAGIPAAYYRAFAAGLADRGVVTMIYDYRGIGRSRPKHLRGYKASIKDWGEFDAPAALTWLRDAYPHRRRAVIGHSIGAFLIGFVQDPTLVDRIAVIGGHTGYWRDYARWARPLMWSMWHAVMPAVTWTLGYFPARRFGLPADLPAGVAYDWAARTRPDFRRNFRRADGSLDVVRHDQVEARFRALRADALSLTFSDDPFATNAGASRLRALLSGCRFEERKIDARSSSLGKIGHFGYFRKSARETLWPLVMDWLVAAAGPAAAARALPEREPSLHDGRIGT